MDVPPQTSEGDPVRRHIGVGHVLGRDEEERSRAAARGGAVQEEDEPGAEGAEDPREILGHQAAGNDEGMRGKGRGPRKFDSGLVARPIIAPVRVADPDDGDPLSPLELLGEDGPPGRARTDAGGDLLRPLRRGAGWRRLLGPAIRPRGAARPRRRAPTAPWA